jgi:uncharacterized membrane protein HdeD (DUF308 family)
MSATSGHIIGTQRKTFNWSIVLSILLIIAGLFAIFVPPIAGVGVTIIVGWLLIFSGIGHIVYSWQRQRRGEMFLELLLGVLYLGAGVYLLWNPVVGLLSLTLGLAIYLFLEAILEFVLAVRLRPAPGSGWLFVDCVITLILAVIIVGGWPLSAAWVVGTLVGISMLFSGTARLMISLATRKIPIKGATEAPSL